MSSSSICKIPGMSWFNRKIVDPLYQILRRGAEPKQLAFSTALGITLGIFPIVGIPMLLCGAAIALLRSHCHPASVMLANFIATPIELSLVVPFLRFGEVITGGPHFPLTSDALKKVITGQASKEVLLSIFRALLGWLVASPLILVVLYLVFLPCFTILVHKFSNRPPSPKTPLLSQLSAEINLKVLIKETQMAPMSQMPGQSGESKRSPKALEQEISSAIKLPESRFTFA